MKIPTPGAPSALSSPFRAVRLSRVDRQRTADLVREWGALHDIATEPIASTVTAYMELCSFEHPSSTGLNLATEYLAWFLVLNDCTDTAERTVMIETAQRCIRDRNHDGTPMGRATQALLAHLWSHAGEQSCERLLTWLNQMLASTQWELSQTGTPIPFDLHQTHREHTIGVYPFLETWRLGENIAPDPQEWRTIERLEQLSVRIIFATNDLLSVRRDQKLGKLNGVVCLANEQRSALETAAEGISRRLLEDTSEFSAALTELQGPRQDPTPARRYAHFLATCAEGNRIALTELAERYHHQP